MMKEEFENLVGKPVSIEDYNLLEIVYASHPSISETNGKAEIATIYNLPGGMRIIRDMVPTAEEAQSIEDQIMAAKNRVREYEDVIEELGERLRSLKK